MYPEAKEVSEETKSRRERSFDRKGMKALMAEKGIEVVSGGWMGGLNSECERKEEFSVCRKKSEGREWVQQ